MFTTNIRELEGALTRVMAYADLRGKPLTEDLVTVALTDLIPQRNTFEPSRVVDVVARIIRHHLGKTAGPRPHP